MPNKKQDVTLVFRTEVASGLPAYTFQHAATVTFEEGNPFATGTVEPTALNSDQLAAIGSQSVKVLLQAINPSPPDFKSINNVVIGLTGTGTKPAFVLPDQALPPITVQALLDYEQSQGGH